MNLHDPERMGCAFFAAGPVKETANKT
jgi:hypothetical protein